MRFSNRAELLAHADQLVEHGEVLCQQQAELVARWRAWGHVSGAAETEAALVRLELTLTEMRLYRARLEADAQDPTP